MTVYVFPGQGAQQPGMGRDLFDRFPRLLARADDLLGWSVRRLCLDDPDGLLGHTAYTQPALYVVCCLDYLDVLHRRRRRPDAVAGHSLGEYAALFAAGAFDFITGLRLVQRRGALMARAPAGGMAAVIGLGAARLADLLAAAGLRDLVVANDNGPDQLVIAGPRPAIDLAPAVLRGHARRCVPLPVSGAFHSPLMAAAAAEFAADLAAVRFEDPIVPVIANLDARPYPPGAVRDRLARQITAPVRWRDSVAHLLDSGETEFEERGPGRTLTRLIEQIAAGHRAVP